LLPIAKNIILGSWWNLTLMVLTLIAQIGALLASGGWAISLRLAQCALAFGNLVVTLQGKPASSAGIADSLTGIAHNASS
jgi:hypothetical protein